MGMCSRLHLLGGAAVQSGLLDVPVTPVGFGQQASGFWGRREVPSICLSSSQMIEAWGAL